MCYKAVFISVQLLVHFISVNILLMHGYRVKVKFTITGHEGSAREQCTSLLFLQPRR
jgi:hypothetical protein